MVEDDRRARQALEALLAEEGYEVVAAADGDEATRLLAAQQFDAALLDVRMPGKDGVTVLKELRHHPAAPAVLVMTAYGNSSVAIDAMRLGAYDYLTKPLHFDELLIQLERAIVGRRQSRELEEYRGGEAEESAPDLVGDSDSMQRVYKLIGQVAATDSTVLIRGESGTGKELVARAIHQNSSRKDGRLVCVNCAAIPDSLLESELFGYEKGAFTGAVSRRKGKFELAHRGTIFLDEIGELSAATQSKLLRVLQERTIERLGAEDSVELDVRILAATNRDLEKAVQDGRFREDLYYRMNVVAICVPPLREHREDIARLVEHLAHKVSFRRKLPYAGILPSTMQVLKAYDWPGNVRELEHALERALILCRGLPISPEHVSLSDGISVATETDLFSRGLHEQVALLEKRLIEKALTVSGGNRTRAAELLKIARRLLYDKIREHGIE